MLLTIENVKQFYNSDKVIEVKLQSLESLLHDTTHNNFARYKLDTGEIDYPIAIIEGLAKIIEWEEVTKPKLGIASESISRHSVTYAKPTDTIYPSDLMSFMNLYKRARF